MQTFVSVIIPTYNRRPFLQKAIDSVLAQTHRDFELIIVDDGSDDDTAQLVAGYEQSRIVYLYQENKGPAAARNTGIKASRYGLIAFLDSDDWFDTHKLEKQVEAMRRQPSYPVSHTEEIWYRAGRVLNQKRKHKKPGGFIYGNSLLLCAVSMSTAMVRKELFDRVGLFDETFACCEDYDFWLRVAAEHAFLLFDEPLTLKDGGRSDQVSFQHRVGIDRYRIKAILKSLASGTLSREQVRLARRELAKKSRIYGNGCLKHGREEEGRYYLDLARQHDLPA